ncbi:hypothetical protein OIU79_002912 [Salix purpurea]|uniref:Uncharacterized protein n=1 Tax=Salix purpurea TaxID=77065 RepID=A0A9Q0UKV5_SALPP|nr:hypothetical protein OIU79_002912 [Salix purpurea]
MSISISDHSVYPPNGVFVGVSKGNECYDEKAQEKIMPKLDMANRKDKEIVVLLPDFPLSNRNVQQSSS